MPIKSHKPPNRTIIWTTKTVSLGHKSLYRPAVVTIEAMDISFMTVSIHFQYKLVLRHFAQVKSCDRIKNGV